MNGPNGVSVNVEYINRDSEWMGKCGAFLAVVGAFSPFDGY